MNDQRERLKSIMLTLQYCLETFQGTCQCGTCDPCTKGQKDIEQAIEDVQNVANDLGIKTLV
jgi:NADH:ubiquinone oxidoreductase subunit F (NADH-binding)